MLMVLIATLVGAVTTAVSAVLFRASCPPVAPVSAHIGEAS